MLAISVNRCAIANNNIDLLLLMPGTFCGITSLVFALTVLFTKKDSAFMHFVVYIAFAGAFVMLIYPNFIIGANTIFYPLSSFSGLIHHSIMLLLVLLVFTTGYFKPNIKRWYAVPLGLTCYMTYGLFLYDILDKRALSIGEAFEGINGLTWFNVGLIFLSVYAIFLIAYALIEKLISKRKSQINQG